MIDEVLSDYLNNKNNHGLANTEFSRRLATERELDKNPDQFGLQTMTFDESSNFLLYPTMLGVKVLNLKTNQCVRVIGGFLKIVKKLQTKMSLSLETTVPLFFSRVNRNRTWPFQNLTW